MYLIVLVFSYIVSVMGSWCAARWMEKRSVEKFNRPTDMPVFIAILFTFCPIVNTIIMVIGACMYLSEGTTATGFYRLDKD